jgi:hypothetical protein
MHSKRNRVSFTASSWLIERQAWLLISSMSSILLSPMSSMSSISSLSSISSIPSTRPLLDQMMRYYEYQSSRVACFLQVEDDNRTIKIKKTDLTLFSFLFFDFQSFKKQQILKLIIFLLLLVAAFITFSLQVTGEVRVSFIIFIMVSFSLSWLYILKDVFEHVEYDLEILKYLKKKLNRYD